MTNITLIILIIILLVNSSNALFKNSLKQLKEKAKNVYKSKFGKDKSWHFLGHDLTEYPGTNKKYRNINQAKWEEYYACLNAQNLNLGTQKSIMPEAILAFEGGAVKLECRICISPSERDKADSVEWEWASIDQTHLHPIEASEHILISPDDKTLHLYNLQVESSGQYLCRLGESLTAPYFLTVTNITDNKLYEVHASGAPLGPYAEGIETIEGFNLILDTEYGPWSTCSKCNTIGRKHRFGYCKILAIHEKVSMYPLNSTVSQTDLELLQLFKSGIPCNSHILPKSLQALPQVMDRKNELMTGFCKTKCPQDQIFEVIDKDGKIIEKANNSAGIYSMLQGLPPVEPQIERRLQYEVKGKNIILICPGNLNSDAPLQWQIGQKNVVPELLSQESNNRIYISLSDRIHIKKSKLADSNIYSCWQQGELAGTIRLVVEKKIQLNFNHHIMLLGIVVILSTFLLVFVKAFFGKKYAKQTIKTTKQ